MSSRHPAPPHIAAAARFDAAAYERAYAQSIDNPERFWGEVGRRLDWIQPYSGVKNVSFNEDDFRIRWYEDGVLNVSFNCLDRHLPEFGDKIAILWQGDSPGESRRISYTELFAEVNQFANALKSLGVRRGDCVTIYLPMIPEAAVAMLACARIGAVHSIVFGGFSPESLADRLRDCKSRVVITADESLRGGKRVPLKANVDTALKIAPGIAEAVIVVPRSGAPVAWNPEIDVRYDDLIAKAAAYCVPEPMGAEDPLFILYTSGSTGKPKGVLHTSAGYLVYAAYTFETIFDIKPDDVFWSTADIGWITGHSYVVYGPLACAATTVMFEGVPTYPNPGRCWEICDDFGVTVFYTAPTAIRALMREGDTWVSKHSRRSLRLLGSVGEPINPEAWEWYHGVVGQGRCPIVDTWWQTETGGIMIAPLPGATELKPGSATRPFFGIQPGIVDANGHEQDGECEGSLVLKDSWPGQMRSVYGDHQRFIDTYFKTYPGRYFTGDGARRDADGDYWITGRVDDVINVSGHRLGTAEIESAMAAHADVAEAAVVGYPHELKGQGIYAFVILKQEREHSNSLLQELQQFVRRQIGSLAVPDVIQWAPGLPKTRSGKIMRRVLRKIAADEADQLGDTTSLADPSVVVELIETRIRLQSEARAGKTPGRVARVSATPIID